MLHVLHTQHCVCAFLHLCGYGKSDRVLTDVYTNCYL